MATFNTTYNFNQKQPSFWQSFGMGMLYQGMGAFGSLTGCGMGMGGYGMGSCMGMGGSLFGMGGFGMGSYGMGMYGMGGYGMGMGCCGMSDAAFGAQMGLMGAGMLMQSVMGSIQGRKANQAAIRQNTASAENNIHTLKNQIDELKAKNTKDKVGEELDKSDASYNTAITSAKSAHDSLKAEADKLNGDASVEGSVLNLYGKYEQLKTKFDQEKDLPANQKTVTQVQIDQAEAAYKEAKERQAKLNAQSGEGSVAQAKQKWDDAVQNRENKINSIIQENNKEIERLETQLNEAQRNLESSVSESDGGVGRFNNSDYESIIGKWNSNDNKFENQSEYNKKKYTKAFNFSFNRFCNASNATERESYRQQALAIYQQINSNGDADGLSQKLDILNNNAKKDFGLN